MGEIYRLPAGLDKDLAELQEKVSAFQAGDMSADEFRPGHVRMGIYDQRDRSKYMLRIRLPAGAVTSDQMRTIAAVADDHGYGEVHATTRQDMQVHGVSAEGMCPALAVLHRSGLATKAGGGDTVRNVAACFDAGVCMKEAFDVTPYAVAVTEHLLSDPDACSLPRKYKVGFSGCPRDCAGALANDVGFVATRRNGTDGFVVYAGGGLGARSRVAERLESFVPADEAPLVAQAVMKVFFAHGDREHRGKARLRFLIERIGFDAFRELYETERNGLTTSPAAVRQADHTPSAKTPPLQQPLAEFDTWRTRCTTAQKQGGFNLVLIPLPLGDITTCGLRALADLAEQHSDGFVRVTNRQNLVMRWIADDALPGLHRALTDLGLVDTGPAFRRDIVSCTGPTTCRLGICNSRDLAKAIRDALSQADVTLPGVDELTINISGCPNACGRHPVAQIGLYGVKRRINGESVPHFTLQLGGRVGQEQTRLAEGKTAIPAEKVPSVIVELLKAFEQSDDYGDFDAFLDHTGRQVAGTLAAH